jgi:hypothetical protein
MRTSKLLCRVDGEVAVGKAAVNFWAVVGNSIRRVRISPLSAIFYP